MSFCTSASSRRRRVSVTRSYRLSLEFDLSTSSSLDATTGRGISGLVLSGMKYFFSIFGCVIFLINTIFSPFGDQWRLRGDYLERNIIIFQPRAASKSFILAKK